MKETLSAKRNTADLRQCLTNCSNWDSDLLYDTRSYIYNHKRMKKIINTAYTVRKTSMYRLTILTTTGYIYRHTISVNIINYEKTQKKPIKKWHCYDTTSKHILLRYLFLVCTRHNYKQLLNQVSKLFDRIQCCKGLTEMDYRELSGHQMKNCSGYCVFLAGHTQCCMGWLGYLMYQPHGDVCLRLA